MAFLRDLLGRKQVAIFVDGPNSIRKGSTIDVKMVRDFAAKYGDITLARVYLDQHASEKLIEAMVNQGFKVEVTSGDVDVTLAVDVADTVAKDKADIIFLVTRDIDFVPAIIKAKEYGKKVIIIGTEIGFGSALKGHADECYIVEQSGTESHLKRVD
ncbi:MAG: NYN domain-containing protein [Candidatus Anstonellales archaeon]